MGTSVNMAGRRFPNLGYANGLPGHSVNMAGEWFPNSENANGISASSADTAGARFLNLENANGLAARLFDYFVIYDKSDIIENKPKIWARRPTWAASDLK